jgi:transposase-like protein
MRTTFSREQIAELKWNPCVFSCSERSIHYTYEFKKRALELYMEGVSPNEIWRRAGFDVSIWKKDYCKYNIRDWRRMVRKGGLPSLTNFGGVQADRGPKAEGVIDSDKVRRLELQVKYLEAENDFLAKLRAKRAESNSGRIRNSKSSEN